MTHFTFFISQLVRFNTQNIIQKMSIAMLTLILGTLLIPGQYLQAQTAKTDRLQEKLKAQTDPDSIHHYSQLLASAYLGSDLVSARKYARQALELSKRKGDHKASARNHYTIGCSYFYQGETRSALLHADSIEVLLADATEDKYYLKNLVLQAASYRAMGAYEKATNYNLKALEIADETDDLFYQGAILNNQGNTYVNLFEYEKALEFFYQALSIHNSLDDQKAKARIYQNMGDVLIDLDENDSAFHYLDLSLANKTDSNTYAITYNSLAKLYIEKGVQDSTEKYVNLALNNARRYQNYRQEIMALNRLGIFLRDEGKYEEARTQLQLAYKKSKELALAVNILNNREILAELEARDNNLARSLEILKESRAFKDSLFKTQNANLTRFFQYKADMEKQKLEIAELALEKAESEAKISRQNYWSAVTSLGLLLVLLVGIFISVIYLRTLKSNKLLASKNEIIIEKNEELVQNNILLEKLNTETRKAQNEAEEANRAKSAFLANMTHEIRTPINGVIGITDIIQHTNPSEEQNGYLKTIRQTGENLLRIVNEILDFSKIEAGKMELEESDFDLFELIDDILPLFASQCAEKNLDLACLIDPQIPRKIIGDPHKLRQVLINLIGNAVKFTQLGGIFIRIKSDSNQHVKEKTDSFSLRFEVEDTGIGITKEQSNKLFQAFSQADTTQKFAGTGLGLVISAKLIELMGGELDFTSVYGKGSRFYFDLEVAPIPPSEFPPAGSLPALKNYWQGKRALIIEMAVGSRAVLSSWLHNLEIETLFAEDYASIIRILEKGSPDLVLYAVDGEDSKGRNLVEYFRQQQLPQKTSLIYLGDMEKIASKSNLEPQNNFALTKPLQHFAFFRLLNNIAFKHEASPPPEVSHILKAPGKLGESLPLKILFADDNEINQMIAMRLFSSLGFQPDFASTGTQVLDLYDNQAYDLIFMDVNMPGLSGLEATKQIRTKYPNSKRPFIISVSASVLDDVKKACLDAGMNDFLSKPFRIDELKAILEKYEHQIKELEI